jgi:hypothetical protein
MATTVQEIESAVSGLSPSDLSRFRQWFEEFDASRWDKQFEADAAQGRLNAIAERAIADYRAGKCKEL